MAFKRRLTIGDIPSVGGRTTIGLPDIGLPGGITISPDPIVFGGDGGTGPITHPGTTFPCAPGFAGNPCRPIGATGPFDPILNSPLGDSFAPSDTGDGCLPLFSRDPITGNCVFDADPGPGTGLPGGNGAAGTGLNRPRAMSRTVLVCPTFADGKKGILWMNALTGDVVCLPRRTSGKGFGLIRKNQPRKKAFISAAQHSSLTKMKAVQTKAKKFATDAGFSCKKR